MEYEDWISSDLYKRKSVNLPEEIKQNRKTEHKINPLILSRWSPRALSGEEISDKYPPFSFGLKKAKLIIKHLEDIKRFVEENEK